MTTMALPAASRPSSKMPTWRAMAVAVIGWSPVTMNTLTEARLHLGATTQSRQAVGKASQAVAGSGWHLASPATELLRSFTASRSRLVAGEPVNTACLPVSLNVSRITQHNTPACTCSCPHSP